MTKESYLIEGMSCASCALTVEKAVKNIPKVQEASVNLTTEKLTVSYPEKEVSPEDIERALAGTGFKAKLYDSYQEKSSQQRHKEQTSKLWKEFLGSAVFAIPLVYIAMGPMIGLAVPSIIAADQEPLNFAFVQALLSLPVLYFGRTFYHNGFTSLFKGHPNMNTLVALATSFAFCCSLFGLFNIYLGHNHYVHQLYFESVVVILTLITLGNYFEAKSKSRTSQAISKLLSLRVNEARLVKDGSAQMVPIEDIALGDKIIIKPGEKIPLDGLVVEGRSYIDESMLTGESIPNEKTKGQEVYAGSINGQGSLSVKVNKLGSETFLSQMITLVEEAQESKAPIAQIADRVSGVFVPIVITLSVLTGLFWFFLMKQDLNFSLTAAIAVLVIACPCALGLATPTAIMVASGRAAQNGILFKGGEFLEKLHEVDSVVFDKTGTITEGKPKLSRLIFTAGKDPNLLRDVASIEQYSEHPISSAIVEEAKKEGLSLVAVKDFKAIVGMGIEAEVNGASYCVGNSQLMRRHSIQLDAEIVNTVRPEESLVYLAKDGRLRAYLLIADQIKEDSKETIAALKGRGIKTIILTGDQKSTADSIARQLGVDQVYSQLLPDQKADIIAQLKKENQVIAMVGDGINDAPALALADIGIAMGSGTDIAIESADLILMKAPMMDLVKAIDLSKMTIRVIKENLFWAFIYNILMIPVAMGILHLFGGPLLSPILAGLAMGLSSISVVLNALRLKRMKWTKRRF
ncbi:heavy metal translocating P-type ATPase [Streptococcus catagoni]|uniref:heavy metal translocating P-type ATPase n=1 Tax=Streptococcus catagoni TaxID=2654874 RepID=UPI00140A466A|nr:heavy metal translocating P-type ATPase [Streptococcus catagoni]